MLNRLSRSTQRSSSASRIVGFLATGLGEQCKRKSAEQNSWGWMKAWYLLKRIAALSGHHRRSCASTAHALSCWSAVPSMPRRNCSPVTRNIVHSLIPAKKRNILLSCKLHVDGIKQTSSPYQNYEKLHTCSKNSWLTKALIRQLHDARLNDSFWTTYCVVRLWWHSMQRFSLRPSAFCFEACICSSVRLIIRYITWYQCLFTPWRPQSCVTGMS